LILLINLSGLAKLFIVNIEQAQFNALFVNGVNILRIQLFSYRGKMSHLSGEHGHKLPFTLDGASGSKNFFGKKFRDVGSGLVEINGRGFWGRGHLFN